MANPLIDDRDAELILDEVLDVARLCALPHFADHDRETLHMFVAAARDLALEGRRAPVAWTARP